MIIDDPFEGKEKDFDLERELTYPSRSPSPERGGNTDIKNFDAKETIFLEDDVELEEIAA